MTCITSHSPISPACYDSDGDVWVQGSDGHWKVLGTLPEVVGSSTETIKEAGPFYVVIQDGEV